MNKLLSAVSLVIIAFIGIISTVLFFVVDDAKVTGGIAALICLGLFLLILRSKKVKNHPEIQSKNHQTRTTESTLDTVYPLRYNTSNPSKQFEFTADEREFFTQLHSSLTDEENRRIKLVRMSNGSIEPYFGSYPLGKVKLQGRKLSMQIFKNAIDFDEVEGTPHELQSYIPFIVKYIRKELRDEK